MVAPPADKPSAAMPHDVTPKYDTVIESQTTRFADNVPGDLLVYDSLNDPTFGDGTVDDTTLAEFLSRPVLIHTGTWPIGSTIDNDVNPWTLFFTNTYIQEKLNRYGLIQCKLVVKIQVNGSPFNYGMMRANYQPLLNFNGGIIDTGGVDFVHLSQRPGVWFDVSLSEGAIMVLPYINYKNWIKINSLADVTNMGNINFHAPAPLFNCNNGTAGTDFSIFAWAEDVKLAAPTTALSLQSGKKMNRKTGVMQGKPKKKVNSIRKPASIKEEKKSEYTMGPVEKIATAVAAASGSLTSIPTIGPFALATSIGAKAFASFASVMGWTNPPNIDSSNSVRDAPFFAMASPHISTPVEKLTLDPKNELTVDTRTIGLDGTDEMTLESIVTRPSYLSNFAWEAADILETTIFSMNISPSLQRIQGVYLSLTPMAHVARCFEYWRGDIIVEFRVACSSYHRGRLQVSWDPNVDPAAVPNVSTVCYNQIFDIAREKIFEVRIPYEKDRAWSTVDKQNINQHASSEVLATNYESFNGKLMVRVLNQLSSPVDLSVVRVIVSVRGAENLSFAAPTNLDNSITQYTAQSGQRAEMVEDTDVQEIHPMTNAEDTVDLGYLVNMGEAVGSIRTLIRRCGFTRTIPCVTKTGSDAVSDTVLFRSHFGHFPLYPGPDLIGVDTTAAIGGYNYCNNLPLVWFANCYLGYRGSLNYHFNAHTPQFIDSIGVTREPGKTHTQSDIYITPIAVGATRNRIVYENVINSDQGQYSGYAVTNQKTQSGLSVQLPLYSPYRMVPMDPPANTPGTTLTSRNLDTYSLNVKLRPAQTATDTRETAIDVYVGAGTDFSFFFYLNVPTYVIAAVPLPNDLSDV